MSASSKLLYDVSSGDRTRALDAYREYMVSHCSHPQLIRIYDAHTASYRMIKVPCGKCYHCMETKINEWVTRMYAHCEDYKYVYFVTLTYASFYTLHSQVSQLILSKLKDAIWHFDNANSTHRYCYRPCLLVKSHYQNFFKRLRKNTKNDSLTYVICGETGKKFGAPHFHAILFSNQSIDVSDVKKAWSVALWRDNTGSWSFRTSQKNNGTAYDVSIGHVDFHDLVTNGTFNTKAKIKVDQSYFNATNCFGYVCKYVCKRSDANLKRVYTAYNSLFEKKTFVKIYDNEVAFDIAHDYCLKAGYRPEIIVSFIDSLKKFQYEKNVPYLSGKIFSVGLLRFRTCKLYGHDVSVELYPEKFYDFVERYCPFVEFSRSTPIGSIYAKNHLHEFVQGVFNRPLLQEKGFVVPNYFRLKADHYSYGIRRLSRTFKSSSYSFGCLPSLVDDLHKVSDGKMLFPGSVRPLEIAKGTEKVLRDDAKCFVDKFSGERFFVFGNSIGHQTACFYKYNKSSRKFEFVRSVPLNVFLQKWLLSLNDEYERYYQKYQIGHDNLKNEDAAQCIINDYTDASRFVVDIERNQSRYLEHKQRDYDACHSFVE